MVAEFVRERLTEVNYDAPPVSTDDDRKCAGCRGEAADDDWMLFVTVYARGQERADWFGLVHDRCRTDVAMAVGMVRQEPLKIAS